MLGPPSIALSHNEIVALDAVAVADDYLPILADLAQERLLIVERPGRRIELRQRSRAGLVLTSAVERLLARLPPEHLPPPDDRAIVIGTISGAVPEIVDFIDEAARIGENLVSPGLFPFTVHNSPAGLAAITSACKGPNLTLSHGGASALAAIILAADILQSQRAKLVFAGGIETQPSPDRGAAELGPTLCGLVALATRSYAQTTMLPTLSELIGSISGDVDQVNREVTALMANTANYVRPARGQRVDTSMAAIVGVLRLMCGDTEVLICEQDTRNSNVTCLLAKPL